MGPDEVYTTLLLDGRPAGALYKMREEDRKNGVPTNWMVYFAVNSADASTARAKELGANIVAGPMDVATYGRMSVATDPTGAYFSLWEAKEHIGARVCNEPGAAAWPELATPDTEKAKAFYTGLFGWGMKGGNPAGAEEYGEWTLNGQSIGGLMKMGKEWGNIPPHWMHYFIVANCDESASTAQHLGASLIVPPRDIPTVGRFSVVRDPQGGVFSIVQLNPM